MSADRSSDTQGLVVVAPGANTTVQDGGRPGFQSKGIPPSGAQDWLSYALGCALVGNELPPAPLTSGYPGDAALEATVTGPTLEFREETVLSLTGASVKATLDGVDVPTWTAVSVPAGATLRCGRIGPPGVRAYVSVAGGFDVPPYLGSRSTYVRGSQGGVDGRALRAGDYMALGTPRQPFARVAGRTVDELHRPGPEPHQTLRVVPGPQEDLFTDEAVETFYEADWALSPVADRMGFRFEGPPLVLKPRPDYLLRDAGSGPADIVDDVIPIGGIQYAGGREPIVMGVEGPSGGGYAKIGTVISADWRVVGQLRPGERIRFQRVDVATGVQLGLDQLAVPARALLTAER